MNAQSTDTGSATEQQPADEMTLLKARAKLMGIVFSNNIGKDALIAKINAKLNEEEDPGETQTNETNQASQASTEMVPPNPLIGQTEPQPANARTPTLREYLMREQMKLVRLRISNLDPKKADLPGEIITVSNEVLGTVQKYIPFGEVTDDGYHVPYCIYTVLKDKMFLDIRSKRGLNGVPQISQKWVREFALEVLPPLSPEDLRELATAQAAAGLFGSDE